MNQKKFNTIVVVILIFLTVLLIFNLISINNINSSLNNGTNTTNKSSLEISDDTTKVFKKVNQSVVTVALYSNNEIIGNGSGSIIEVKNNKAMILTNNHVVSSSKNTEIRVIFHDKKEISAKVVGKDSISDLALLECQTNMKLTPIEIGDSDALQEGETVIAIGSPLDIEFKGTVTRGIISGVNRTLETDTNGDGVADYAMQVIQTDTTINPGNSGGPLINMAGQMVGINTSKISMESFEGMGFAIPVNDAMNIIEQLQENGEIERPKLGISYQAVSVFPDEVRLRYNIPDNLNEGIYIIEVDNGSAAAKAGLKPDDIIFNVNGKDISSLSVFTSALFSSKKGDVLKLKIYRDNKEKSINVSL